MNFNKTIIAIALSSTLAACGGSSSSPDPVVTPPPPPEPQSVSGTASKGLILGGTVTAYLINSDGTKGDSVGTATTDTTDGSYELTLDSNYDGEPLIIEITATDGSQMKCDLSVCLADDDDEIAITFGELYNLPSDFELSAVSSGSESNTISINITPLTDVASALTLDKVAGGADPSSAAESSNYQIANLLGLDGDVTELPIVDLTDADEINAASADELEANLKSAAIVEAALSDSSEGTSLEEALDNFTTQYVNSSGIADTEGVDVDTASISLEEIAAASQLLTSTIVTEVEGVNAEDENMSAVETALMTEEAEASTGSTEPTQGDVPDDIGSEGLIAAKAFVSQVSTFSLATQLDSTNTFEDEISLAADLASNDLDTNTEALALAAAAIAEAFVAYNEEVITTYQSGDITVAISVSDDVVTYTVDQTLDIADAAGVATTTTINLVAINAVFSDSIVDMETNNETETGYTYTWSSEGEASIDIALSGSVSTDQVSISINDGSQFVATLSVDEEGAGQGTYTQDENSSSNSESETESGLISVSDVEVGLSVTIAQVASSEVTDPIEFTGAFNIVASLLSIDYDEAEQWENSESSIGYSGNYSDNGTEIISIDGLNASLSGTFSNSSNSLEASVAIAASGIVETCTWNSESVWSNTGTNTHTHSNDCSLSEETVETFASASITVRFDIDIDGIENDVALVANIQRTGLESGIASVDLTYGGNQLDFAFNTDDIVEEGEGDTTITTTSTATLTNHNSVILTITVVETDYVDDSTNVDTIITTGVITYEGEEFATVSDDGIVTFSDGTFVTL